MRIFPDQAPRGPELPLPRTRGGLLTLRTDTLGEHPLTQKADGDRHAIMKTLGVLSLLGLVALLLVTGCQSSKPGSASHAAVEIKGHSREEVRTTTIVVFAEQGYQLRTNSPTLLVFDRPATTREMLKYGDWMNEGMVMEIKVRLQALEANATLLRADAYVVQDPVNPVFRSEHRIMSFSGKPYRLMLEEVLHRLEGPPTN